MFDPHRTRRSDKRYYTRKGQVLQAGRVNTQPIIEQRLVPIYKNYLLNNGLIDSTPSPPSPPSPDDKINIEGVFFENASGQVYSYPITSMTLSTDPTINYSNNTGMRGGVILALFQDASGFYHLTAAGVQSGTLTLNIENNAKCRYIYTTNWAPAPDVWKNSIKGIYTDTNQTIISTRSNELNFSEYARLDFS